MKSISQEKVLSIFIRSAVLAWSYKIFWHEVWKDCEVFTCFLRSILANFARYLLSKVGQSQVRLTSFMMHWGIYIYNLYSYLFFICIYIFYVSFQIESNMIVPTVFLLRSFSFQFEDNLKSIVRVHIHWDQFCHKKDEFKPVAAILIYGTFTHVIIARTAHPNTVWIFFIFKLNKVKKK